MINSIPDTWEYNEILEMLFLFYQISDELLSETTPDTFSLPLHNSMTLVGEIGEIYNRLNEQSLLDKYYSTYIPVIIDELLASIEQDALLKKRLDNRLDSIKTGFIDAKSKSVVLERWVGLLLQCCSPQTYLELYASEIIRLVSDTKNKKDLIYCAKNYYISLLSNGYSREFLYQSIKKYFDNFNIRIKNACQIVEFLKQFTKAKTSMEFLILMDIATVDYLDSISSNLTLSKNISKIDVQKERRDLEKDISAQTLLKDYDNRLHSSNTHQKISIIRYRVEHVDPISAMEEFEDYIRFLQSFNLYFKHYRPTKQIYKSLVKSADGHYKEVKTHSKLLKRPYVNQATIDSRIKNILNAKAMSYSTFNSVANAIQMHADAFDSRNLSTIIKSLWTAMETIFSNPVSINSHENVLHGIVATIQKTYILKRLRSLYAQLQDAIDTSELQCIGIKTFKEFVVYFSSHTESSEEMKKIYSLLSFNPLMRSRLFELRKSLSTGNNIKAMLDKHRERIEWQVKRLYRTRNIATHIGQEMSYSGVIINHLHNYFDFVVNYILCKSENDDFIISVPVLVFEAQNDNKIHTEMIKTNQALSQSNYISFLFGPDCHLMNYEFEF